MDSQASSSSRRRAARSPHRRRRGGYLPLVIDWFGDTDTLGAERRAGVP